MDRYQVQERLGHGGMGEVWRGTRSLGKGPPQTVAFKFIKDRLQRGVATIEQFEREARTTMMLHHPNIAAVYDLADVNEQPCIVMEHVNGINLQQLARHVSIPANVVRCILLDVLGGLQHAHECGILHRDLSPANIMIDRDGVSRLMDFGVAKNLNESHSLGLLVGTMPFMAPETLEAQQWSPASDIYSLGAVFYSVFTGTPPYGTGDRLKIMNEMRSRGLRSLPDDVPADLRTFIMAALYPSTERLGADYAAAVAALEPIGSDERMALRAEVRKAMVKSDPRGIESRSTLSAPEDHEVEAQQAPSERASSSSQSVSTAESKKRGVLVILAVAVLLVLGLAIGDHWRTATEESRTPERDTVVLSEVPESFVDTDEPSPLPADPDEQAEQEPAPLPERADEGRNRTTPPQLTLRRLRPMQSGVLVSP